MRKWRPLNVKYAVRPLAAASLMADSMAAANDAWSVQPGSSETASSPSDVSLEIKLW